MGVFVIAEAGSSHDNDLQKAYRLIEAAKECGADAVKFQWTSNGLAMAHRRGLGMEAGINYVKWLEKPLKEWLGRLAFHCKEVGIEFMCSTFLVEDVIPISFLVKRFKISAYECEWAEFVYAHKDFGKPVIISKNPGQHLPDNTYWADVLHCVSEYPTPLERLGLRNGMQESNCVEGFSDHTGNVLAGAAAVAAGATIIEAHIRLHDTDKGNPDYGHSLTAWTSCDLFGSAPSQFKEYVANIRTIERML